MAKHNCGFMHVYYKIGIWKGVYYRDNKTFPYLICGNLEECCYDSNMCSIVIKDCVSEMGHKYAIGSDLKNLYLSVHNILVDLAEVLSHSAKSGNKKL